MRLVAPVLLLAWLGAGQALAQDTPAPSAVEPGPSSVAEDKAESVGAEENDAADAAAAPADGSESQASTRSDSVTASSAGGASAAAAAQNELVPSDGTAAEAGGDASLEALNRKLLGDVPDTLSSPTERRMEQMDLPETPGWIWPVGLTLLALLIGLRWQLNRGTEAPSRLRVVQRVMLGRDGNLAVVEVGDEGDRRRLLVGYGGGAPRLVAELDVPDTMPTGPSVGDTSAAQGWQRALRRAMPGGVVPPGSGPTAQTAGVTGAEAEPRLRPRTSLIAEVLAERDTGEAVPTAPAAVADADYSDVLESGSLESPVVEAPEKGEDGAPTETYTFRGLIG